MGEVTERRVVPRSKIAKACHLLPSAAICPKSVGGRLPGQESVKPKGVLRRAPFGQTGKLAQLRQKEKKAMGPPSRCSHLIPCSWVREGR